MATYTGTWNFYNTFKKYKGDGTIDLDDTTADRFKVGLTTSSYIPSAIHSVLADITNELSATGGYSRQSLTGVTWVEDDGTTTWDADNITFVASGADFDAARYWFLFDDSVDVPLDPLIAWGLIDNTPSNVTVTDGTDLVLQWSISGLFSET